MPWPNILLRDRRVQVRDDIAAHLPGADASVPNSVQRIIGDAQASLTHDNDRHLAWVVRQMMPDTAEAEFADRWASIWLPQGRKGASYASGHVTVTGAPGAQVPTGAQLTATVFDDDGAETRIEIAVTQGVTLAAASAVIAVEAVSAGALGNLTQGAALAFLDVPAGIDGQATVAAPGFSGGADAESDAALRERYIDVIQNPPHGGSANDYRQWALDLPGVTRAWAAQEMGIGTVTVRFMMDDTRADGLPTPGDVALVAAALDVLRPVTVADLFVVAPLPQPLDITIDVLTSDTPETRAAIVTEIRDMLRARASPGGIVYRSWIAEAISAATGEDHHDAALVNVVPASAGHIIVPGTVTFA